MKIKQLFFALITTICFTTAQAQVKIGANPSVIGSTSNLEVEATNGNKTSVNKATGQVTIQDGTQGTGKVFTSDASGVASWQNTPTQNTDVWIYAKGTGDQAIPSGTTIIQFSAEVYDRGNNYNPATSRITIPSAGIYQLSTGLKKTTNSSGTFNLLLSVYVNDVLHTTTYEDGWADGATLPRASGALTLQLNAGDVVDIRIRTTFTTYSIGQAYLTFLKLTN